MYYIPRLADGKLAPLIWQVRLIFSNGNWPLKDDATRFEKFIDKLSLTCGFLSLTIIIESEFNCIAVNRHDLGLVLQTMATILISMDALSRIYHMALKRAHFKALIKDFYAEIYIERTENKSLYDEVQRKTAPTRIGSYSYYAALCSVVALPITGFFKGEKLFPYNVHPHYDYRPWPAYVVTLLMSIWASNIVVTQVQAEANMIAILILNLNGRYLLLQRDLRELYDKSKISANGKIAPELILPAFRAGLVEILQRNIKLNQFARRVQAQYSFPMFIMLALSALLLCVLGFEIKTVGMCAQTIACALWICTKVIELLVFGELGSNIIQTTDRMSTAYYLSNWEQVIQHSGNARQNAQLMKLITIAIELNQKPICFTGSGFFDISLSTVITILRGAVSYFTVLYAIY